MEIPPNQEPNPFEIAAQAAAQVERSHPTIGVKRDEVGAVEITEWREPDNPDTAERLLELRASWVNQDRGPDLAISVYACGEELTQPFADDPISKHRVRTSDGSYQIEQTQGARVDQTKIITTAQKGIDLFDQWEALPQDAQWRVRASKVYDAMRTMPQIEEFDAATSTNLRSSMEQTGGSPSETFTFIKDTVGRLEQPPQESSEQQH